MTDHTHYEYAHEIKRLESSVSDLKSGLRSVDRRVDGIDASVSSIQSDVSDFRSKLATLSRRCDSLDSAVAGLHNELADIDRHLGKYADEVLGIVKALQEGNAQLAAIGENLSEEAGREEQARARFGAAIDVLRAAQVEMGESLALGVEQTQMQVEELKAKEDTLHQLLKSVTDSFQEKINQFNVQTRQQLSRLIADVTALADEEREGRDQLEEQLGNVVNIERTHGLSLDAVREHAQRMALSLNLIAGEEDQRQSRRRRTRAAEFNAVGMQLLANAEPAEAASWFRQAVLECPEQPECRHNLAVALIKAGRFPEAEQEYAQLAETSADWPEVTCLGAVLRLAQSDTESAAALFERLGDGMKDQWPCLAGAAAVAFMQSGKARAAWAQLGAAARTPGDQGGVPESLAKNIVAAGLA